MTSCCWRIFYRKVFAPCPFLLPLAFSPVFNGAVVQTQLLVLVLVVFPDCGVPSSPALSISHSSPVPSSCSLSLLLWGRLVLPHPQTPAHLSHLCSKPSRSLHIWLSITQLQRGAGIPGSDQLLASCITCFSPLLFHHDSCVSSLGGLRSIGDGISKTAGV